MRGGVIIIPIGFYKSLQNNLFVIILSGASESKTFVALPNLKLLVNFVFVGFYAILRINNSFDLFHLNKIVGLSIMSIRFLVPLSALHLFNN